jgi:hypothetical protein
VYATEMHIRLQELQLERRLASTEGLAHHAGYMADLEQDIALASHAYIGAAVTEIATLRAELSGPLEG